jgi:hypothetical protein
MCTEIGIVVKVGSQLIKDWGEAAEKASFWLWLKHNY